MRLVDVKVLEMQTKEAFKENPVVMGMLLRWLRKQPTVDAVPVVRCRECKEYRTLQAMTYYKNGVHIRCCPCELMGRLMKDDDFCSYGERKDGEG